MQKSLNSPPPGTLLMDKLAEPTEQIQGSVKLPRFDSELELETESSRGWLKWFKWIPTSMSLLRIAEKKILSYVKTPFRGHYVNVGPIVGKDDCKLWTISLNETSKNTPIVLLHGLGSGVALWAMNLDSFASNRPTHAFDILGFGRSSRPKFSNDALDAERELVQSIEEWRREMKLERFILLGHSMGGFLATSYAIKYPKRVAHLIAADPWGFPEKPADISQKFPLPFWVKMLAFVLQPLNPLWGIRFAGPMGPKLVERARPDLIRKFSSLNGEEVVDPNSNSAIAEYIFHCNAQNPSGEGAFHSLMSSFGWAKYPQINRIPSLHKDVPLTLIYGSRSWIDHSPGKDIKEIRGSSYVDVQIIQGAGHHVYADKKDEFNQIVVKVCELADSEEKNQSIKASSPNKLKESLEELPKKEKLENGNRSPTLLQKETKSSTSPILPIKDMT